MIRHERYKRRIFDFDGLRWGRIGPTDMDAFIEFGNRLFVFVESKHGNAPMPVGQRLALERVCDACHAPPSRYAVAFVTSYESEDDVVRLADTKISQFRFRGEWRNPKTESSLADGVDAFVKRFIKR